MYLTPRTGHTQAMYCGITTGGEDSEDGMTAAQALATGWHHVAVTIDAAGKTDSLYLDGQVIAKNTAARYTPSSLGNTTQNWLGRSQYSGDACFNGSLDDLRIYDCALSAQDVLLCMLGAAVTPSGTIPIENFSFELPGTVKIKGWNGEGGNGTPAVDIPGWSSDTVAADSGVETDCTPTDGLWTAFLKAGDPAVWQLTDHTIAAGEVFELKVDARITWNPATTLLMVLYYDYAGIRIPAAIRAVGLTETMQEYTLSFNAAYVPASVGRKMGIEFTNVTTSSDSWLGMDNVRLSVVP